MTSDGGLRRLLGHSAIYVVGTSLQSALSLVLLPVVTRILSVEEYGVVAIAAASASLLAILYGLGLNFAIVRFYYDDPQGKSPAAWSALFRAQAVVAVGLAAATYASGPLWAGAIGQVGWHGALQIAVVLGLVSALQTTGQGVLRAANRPVAFVIVSLLQIGIGTTLGIGLAIEHGATGYMAGMCVGSAIAAAATAALIHRPARWSAVTLRSGLALSLPFMVHHLATWGMSLADRLLLAIFVAPAAVGRYQVAYFAGSALLLVLTSIQSAWAPFFIGTLDERDRQELLRRLIVPVTALVSSATVALVAAAPVALQILVPDDFRGAALVIAIVAAASVPRAGYLVAVVALLDRRRSGVLASSSVVAVAVTIAVNVALIPVIGITAAAIAAFAASAVQSLLVIRHLERLAEMSMRAAPAVASWVVTAAVAIGVAELPLTPAGTAARVAVVFATAVAGVATLRALRQVFASLRSIRTADATLLG